MPKFLDTRGRTKLAIAVCGRCGIKMPYDELRPDPNFPGVMVCADDYDDLDPYRLPARQTEDITLEHPRPDLDISGPSPVPIYLGQIEFGLSAGGGGVLQAGTGEGLAIAAPVTQINPAQPWAPSAQHNGGDQVIPGAPGDAAPAQGFAAFPPQPYLVLTCIVPGTSGDTQPTWPIKTGQTVEDGQIVWLCTGVFLNDSTPAPNTTSQPTQGGQLIFDEQIPGNPLIGAVE